MDIWIFEWNIIIMNREQTIFLDTKPYSTIGHGLINQDTQVLNLILGDMTPQTDCCLIGNQMEWKPLIWMQHEKNRIRNLKSLRIINLEGKLRNTAKQSVKDTAAGIDVDFIDMQHFENWIFMKECQDLKHTTRETDRIHSVAYSVGTMRLNRFVLLGWCQKNNLSNIGQPLLTDNELFCFNHVYKRLMETEHNMRYKNKRNRLFGEVDQDQFNKLQMSLLSSSYINFVTLYPNYNIKNGFYCEKAWYPMLCKTLPFFVGNLDDNANLKMYGFRPYVGFDYSADCISNPIVRWQKLLEDNKKFFLDIDESRKIHNLNKEIIEYNYNKLTQTDWKKLAYQEVQSLPAHIQTILQDYAPSHYKRLC